MTWREDLRRVDFGGKKLVGASFRGVSFFVEESQRSGGRRTVRHEFPFRDSPFIEDIGQRGGDFSVTGYVIGDDYLVQRDKLITALEGQEGPGELVHPYHGIKRAICDRFTTTERRADGGMAMFSIDFMEAPAQAPVPTIETDPVGKVAPSADAAVKAAKTELAEKLDPAGLPAFALASAETALKRATAALGAKLALVTTETQEAARLASQIRLLTVDASSLVRQPSIVLDRFRAAITGLVNAAKDSPGAVRDALVAAYTVDLGPAAPETTATRKRERANQLALTGGLRRVLAIEAARLAPLATYASIEDAIAARDQIAGLLEEQAAGAGDTAYPALVDLRSEVLRAVPGGAAFARVVTITRRTAVPSLLLAYQLYGSVDQEADIIARNKIRHPGFISGELKVLSDGG